MSSLPQVSALKASERSRGMPVADALSAMDELFAAAMAHLVPFENSPHLAVAVSGGSDSMALCRLAATWAGMRGGRITALTVDHGLRSGSADEVLWVAREMAHLNVEHVSLVWAAAKPVNGLQAAARDARYALLRQWCKGAGVLHLLVGHQAEDQAETHLMRRARAPKADEGTQMGLAGMSACVEYSDIRLLRPLLGVARSDLRGYLERCGQHWLDDPSNRNDAFERVRVRQRLARDESLLTAVGVAAAQDAKHRKRIEKSLHRDLARCSSFQPTGFARLDLAEFRIVAPVRRPMVLARMVLAVGGLDYGPRRASLVHLADGLTSDLPFPGMTLGRCRLMTESRDTVLVCRENRHLPDPVAFPDRTSSLNRSNERQTTVLAWDNRFDLYLPSDQSEKMVLAPLGDGGWRQIPRNLRVESGLPQAVARTLPALYDRDGLYWSPVAGVASEGDLEPSFQFRPKNTVAFTGFCIA